MTQSSPLAEFVRLRIMDLVDENELEAGEKLPSERVLAEKFGVSRTSLRKALATLEDTGVISSVHGSGTYLAQTTGGNTAEMLTAALLENNRDLPDVVPVRSALESLAARLAAHNHSSRDAAVLQKAINGMETAAASGKKSDSHSQRFHQTLWKASRNTILEEQLQSLQPHFNRLRDEALAQPKSLPRAIVSHQQILDAILERDADLAGKLMEEHILEGAQSPLAQSNIPVVCF